MLQRSPILRFALEVFEHALESAVSKKPRDRKLAVINLAQCIELAVKAALVEKNVSIYMKDSAKTVTPHEALKALANLWSIDRVPMHSRLEVLIDERNAIQHRYGDVDEVTLDYHLETSYRALEEILKREFDVELGDWVRDAVSEEIWKQIRFVQVDEVQATPSEASQPDRSATLDLVDGFSRFEAAIRSLVEEKAGEPLKIGSTLDLAIKTMAASEGSGRQLIQDLPGVYRLRNRVIHGEQSAEDEEVEGALKLLDRVLDALHGTPADLMRRALETVRLGVRGARVLSWDEINDRSRRSAERIERPSGDLPPQEQPSDKPA